MKKLMSHTYEYVYNYFKERGCKLTSKEYVNNRTPLDYICSCGNPSKITFKNFKGGNRCKKCIKNNPKRKNWNAFMKTMDFVKGFFTEMHCKLLSPTFNNDKDKLNFICSCGKEDTITFGAFKRGLRCKTCSNNKSSRNLPYTIEFIDYYFTYLDMKLLSNIYVNSQTELKYVCTCGNVAFTNFARITMGHRCEKCAISRRSGEKNHMYDEGQTPLVIHLRDRIGQWKRDSMKLSNYKCTITGKSFDVVHHLYGFNLILKETMNILNLKYYDEIDRYTKEELINIEKICFELHYKNGLGVCLVVPIHKLFHSRDLYGIGDNTPEEFEEFKVRLKSGEFNDYLLENNLTLII